MSNMSYCRFENTAADLADCADALHDPCSEREHRARKRLIRLCVSIVEELGGPSDAVEQADSLSVEV